MLITFVRHGESINNSHKRHHDTDSDLSELGRIQAQQMKLLFATNTHDAIFTSPLLRAYQTATIIHGDAAAIISDSRLQEIRKPSILNKLAETDSEFQAIKQALLMHGHKPDWKHSDEESFYDFHRRIKDFLHSITHTNALVITHSGVMRMVIAIVNHSSSDEQTVIRAYLDSRHTIAIENGTVITLKKTDSTIELAQLRTNSF
jgi:broad specificity phosphatase PhoE